MKILAGTIDLNFGLEREVGKVIIHEQYSRRYVYNDVGLMGLIEPLPLKASISAITLFEGKIPDRSEVVIAGWGRTSSNEASSRLKFNTLHALSEADCDKITGVGHRGIICIGHAENNGACFVSRKFY